MGRYSFLVHPERNDHGDDSSTNDQPSAHDGNDDDDGDDDDNMSVDQSSYDASDHNDDSEPATSTTSFHPHPHQPPLQQQQQQSQGRFEVFSSRVGDRINQRGGNDEDRRNHQGHQDEDYEYNNWQRFRRARSQQQQQQQLEDEQSEYENWRTRRNKESRRRNQREFDSYSYPPDDTGVVSSEDEREEFDNQSRTSYFGRGRNAVSYNDNPEFHRDERFPNSRGRSRSQHRSRSRGRYSNSRSRSRSFSRGRNSRSESSTDRQFHSSSSNHERSIDGNRNDNGSSDGTIHYHIHINGHEVLTTTEDDGNTSSNESTTTNVMSELLQRLLHRHNTTDTNDNDQLLLQNGPVDDVPYNNYDHDEQRHEEDRSNNTRSRRTVDWQSIFHAFLALVAVVTHICYWYGDVRFGIDTTTTQYNVGGKLSSSSWQQSLWPVVDDDIATDDGSQLPSWVFPRISQWKLTNRLNTMDVTGDKTSVSKVPIFGQNTALQILEQRLQRWSNEGSATASSHFSWNGRRPFSSTTKDSRLLVLYLTGGGTPSLGKTSVVYRMLEKIILHTDSNEPPMNALESCQRQWQESKTSQNDLVETETEVSPPLPPCPLIHMDPADITASDGAQQSTTVQRDIVSDMQERTNSDLIILLSKVDEWETTSIDNLNDVGNTKSMLQQVLDDINENRSLLTNHRTIIVMTSNVGSGTQDKWLRKQLQQYHSDSSDADDESSSFTLGTDLIQKELIPLLEYEVQQYHSSDTADKREVDGRSQQYQRWSIPANQWTVIPFNVVDRNTAKLILLNYIEPSPSTELSLSSSLFTGPQQHTFDLSLRIPFPLQVTSRGLDKLLDDDLIEWYKWIHKSTGNTLREWSPNGASQILKLWNDRVVPALMEKHDQNNVCISIATKATMPDNDNGSSSSSSWTTVLDVDEGSTNKFLLRSCHLISNDDDIEQNKETNDNNNDDGHEDSPSDPVTTSDNNIESSSCDGRKLRAVKLTFIKSAITTVEEDDNKAYCCPSSRPSCKLIL